MNVSGRNPLYPRVGGLYMQAGLIGVSREDGHRYRAADILKAKALGFEPRIMVLETTALDLAKLRRFGCEDRIRTDDLLVMSQAHY